MATTFDRETWKARVAAWWRDTAPDWQGTMDRLGVKKAYGLLTASAFLPLLAVYGDDPGPAVAALSDVVSSVGTNLLSNLVQGAYDKATAPQRAEQEIAERPELREEYQRVLGALDALGAAQSALGEQWADFENELKQELAQMGGELHVETDGGVLVFGSVKVRYGDFVGRDKHEYHYHYYDGPPPDVVCLGPDDAHACYLAHVIDVHRKLKLQGIRSASGLVSIDLEEVYVTLTATVRKTVQAEETWLGERAALAPGEAQRLGREQPRETVQQVKVQVQEALAMYPRLVVLGDPGSGKTTLLRYLALTYARDLTSPREAHEEGAVSDRLGLDERCLPILLPLRDFARYLEREHPDIGADGPKLLRDYLRIYFQNQDIPLPPDFFAERLKEGACVVLLDGVDEVASMPLRQRVARLIEKFTLAYPDNRYVVTSRIVGYTGGARLGAEFEVTTVRDFTDEDIARFVRHWNRAVEIELSDEATPYVLRQAEAQSQALLEAIHRNERVRELAVNPLRLTVIALVHRYRAQLPERRVELYEEAIEVLLVQWDAVKGLSSTAVLQGLELDAGDRRSLLEPVALWMMEQRVRELDLDDLRRRLARPFKAMLKDLRQTEKAVNGFVHLINARSGLLTERGMGVYAFSHLTFQEHLAARAVADREDYVDYTLARIGDSWWCEVVLLEAGYLSTQGKRRATELIQAVMDCTDEPEPYHNLVLAAEALCDVGQARIVGDLVGEVQRRLRSAFETPLHKGGELKAAIQRRSAAAEALAKVESGMFGT